jgi:hypothetical protein
MAPHSPLWISANKSHGTYLFPVKLSADTALEVVMGFGRGALLWLIGIPIPVINLIALFMHH